MTILKTPRKGKRSATHVSWPLQVSTIFHNICFPKTIWALWKQNVEYFRTVRLGGNSLSLRLDIKFKLVLTFYSCINRANMWFWETMGSHGTKIPREFLWPLQRFGSTHTCHVLGAELCLCSALKTPASPFILKNLSSSVSLSDRYSVRKLSLSVWTQCPTLLLFWAEV